MFVTISENKVFKIGVQNIKSLSIKNKKKKKNDTTTKLNHTYSLSKSAIFKKK